MNSAEQSERDCHFFAEMRESAPDDLDSPAVQPASLTGILLSPFANPYPTQRPGSIPVSGLTGELRGYYHRSDGVDRWKPSWSNFDHPRSGNRHKGVDIYAPIGTDVVAISDGYAVLYPNPTPGDDLGIKIGMTITGSDGTKYDVLYGHLSSLNGVTRAVRKGDILGKTGCSGNAEDGTCSTANTCGGFSSHLHVAVRESKSGAQYVDPVSLFNWRLGYVNDNRDVPCDQAFTAKMLEHFENGGGEISSPDLMDAVRFEGPSKSYRLAFFGEKISSNGEARLIIFENILITLKVKPTVPFPGVMVSIKGRQRMFFHPSLAPKISYALTAFFENVDADGNSTGDTVHVPLVTIQGEAISDTGLRSLWVEYFCARCDAGPGQACQIFRDDTGSSLTLRGTDSSISGERGEHCFWSSRDDHNGAGYWTTCVLDAATSVGPADPKIAANAESPKRSEQRWPRPCSRNSSQ